MVADRALVVDEEPFGAGAEPMKPDARVEVRRDVGPVTVFPVGRWVSIGVEQDQRSCCVDEGVIEARYRSGIILAAR